MNLLDLAHLTGLNPKRVASTSNGEYHSACPFCQEGHDRFIIHPEKVMKNCVGSYFCRRCNKRGDVIQFCIDALQYSFQDAVNYVGATIPEKASHSFLPPKYTPPATTIKTPHEKWQYQAQQLIEQAHTHLLLNQEIIDKLTKRGLPLEAIKQYKIGLTLYDNNQNGEIWGQDKEKIWIPAGIMIPVIEHNKVVRLKIRRTKWHENDTLPKYVIISGSMSGLNIIGNKKKPIMIVVESELDAYALHHSVQDLAVIIAVGGCLKNPDTVTDYLAQKKNLLLICYDNDNAGVEMFNRWQRLYPHAQPCPTEKGKDIGNAIEQELNLRLWIISKIPVSMQFDLNIPQPWSLEDQILIDWMFAHINQPQINRSSYETLIQELLLGSNSPRAKTREIQDAIQLMKKLIEVNNSLN
ncbi:toprim domain-containing protein [Candidatus Babeliales bacterium]|nr:toprim domain-containing protein [Candidatus Babeliales bacterium]MBP9843993.1 toprim domain-containing protein [Candidatus Babeliales bacterium]